MYSPFKNTWWCRSFEVTDSDGTKDTVAQYVFFKNYAIEKYIAKIGKNKPAVNVDLLEFERVNKLPITEAFFQGFIEYLHKFDNTKLDLKICNESDVPVVTP